MPDRYCPIAVGPGGLVVVITPAAVIGACAERGWSLTELAAEARISRPTLRAALQGHPVRPRTAWKLAQALDQASVPNALPNILKAS
jgi:lambda repressor-like predicted transcriptional regulator